MPPFDAASTAQVFYPQAFSVGLCGVAGTIHGAAATKYLTLLYVVLEFATAPSSSSYQINVLFFFFFFFFLGTSSIHLYQFVSLSISQGIGG